MKKNLWAITYSLALISFTVYAALDTFVIPRVYTVVDENVSGVYESQNGTGYVSGKIQSSSSQNSTEDDSSGSGFGDATKDLSDETNSETNTDNVVSSDGSAYLTDENAGTDSAPDDASNEAQVSSSVSQYTEPVITDTSYSDGNINIEITTYRAYDTDIYVADITLSDASYLQTALAQSAYGKNVTEKTSEIASESNAILAINGDYYGSRERGIVIRNGVLYRDSQSTGSEDLVIYSDGTFEIITEGNIDASALVANGAMQVFSFGPALVENGTVSVTENDEVGKAMVSNPRSAIGIIDELHYVFVVSDGRTDESNGLTLYELASFMEELGVSTAYNLDGGGSSTLYFNGSIINNPTTDGRNIRERSVSDIVFIGG